MAKESPTISLFNKTLNVEAEDRLIDSWGFISHPGVVALVVPTYYLCVYLGPTYMAKKEPYKLKITLLCYNVFQILMNCYILTMHYELLGSQSWKWWENLCYQVSIAQNFEPVRTAKYLEVIKMYYINKIVDMLDTIFFVLRKKQSQITFLHVFHHCVMVILTFITLTIVREEMSLMFAAINSTVHVIMYTYYFLAAAGPKVQKYLWWKKYITIIQMVQFVIALSMMVSAMRLNCPIDWRFYAIWFFNVSFFLIMFMKFYFSSYKVNKNLKTSIAVPVKKCS